MVIAKWFGGIWLGLLFAIGPAWAEMSDREFMAAAIQINLAEIELGKLGQEKAQDQAVRAYAEKMVADHTKANEQALALAQQLDMKAPAEPREKDQAEYKKLQDITSGFDKAFMNVMIKGHQEAVNLFDAQTNAKGPSAKFARNLLPELQHHLAEAQAWSGS
ncbi:DUF4142 domain-containing protein [Rhodoligotrophos defluvii]|uniref:DUF4142 domain-containing protein n=1 Tax=Rhodoligotrophos defluvii TaxID=2561934 RepID=UPI0010CA0414|nr:DUF4142 domain-containing protein [Rhodoligotrophos defluvii]